MSKWQYKTLVQSVKGMARREIDTDEVEIKLNDLGAEGWELVRTEILQSNGWAEKVIFIFKKEVSI